MMKMLDLFSGLGGASEAFLNNGWDVKRIENNPILQGVPNTENICVLDFANQLESYVAEHGVQDPIKFVWASPPCTDFSLGYNSPRSEAHRAGLDYYPGHAIELVKTAKHIIDLLQPQYWCIENVKGSIKYLKPILGEPTRIVGSYVLWGRFPAFECDTPPTKASKDVHSANPLRANLKAQIPYELSDAFRVAIENQKTLDYWF